MLCTNEAKLNDLPGSMSGHLYLRRIGFEVMAPKTQWDSCDAVLVVQRLFFKTADRIRLDHL